MEEFCFKRSLVLTQAEVAAWQRVLELLAKKGIVSPKLDSIACQITDAELFDEAKFIGALRERIIQALSHEHATILGNLKDSDGKKAKPSNKPPKPSINSPSRKRMSSYGREELTLTNFHCGNVEALESIGNSMKRRAPIR